MRPKMQEQLKELLALPKGFLLFGALPANGLRSSMGVILHCTDRFTREFAAVEEETNRYEPVENVPVTTYSAAQGQTPADVLIKLFRTEPNVVVVRDLVNAQTVSMMCREIVEDRLMISTIRAKDCAEAMLRVLALDVPPVEFAKAVSGVLSQRLVRKLCESCKEAYAPAPQILQQLGIPEGRIQAFYRPAPARPGPVPRKFAKSATASAISAGRRFSNCWPSATMSAGFWRPIRNSICCVRPRAKTAWSAFRKKASCWWPRALRRCRS